MSIPVSNIVKVLPGVIGTGGNPLSMDGVFITDNDIIPLGITHPYDSINLLGITFAGTGSGSVALSSGGSPLTSSGTRIEQSGSTVKLTCTANSGNHFVSWSGVDGPTNNAISTVVMNADKTVTLTINTSS